MKNYRNDEFQSHFRMPFEAFEALLENITPLIDNSVDVMHMTIPVEKQVLAVIWLLANRESYRYA